MPYRKIDNHIKSKIQRLLAADHWRSDVVVSKSECFRFIAYKWDQRLRQYETLDFSKQMLKNRSRDVCTLIRNSMLKYHKRHFYLYQDEFVRFLNEKWCIEISRSTVNRILKSENISRKKEQRVNHTQNRALRIAWQVDMIFNFVTH